MKLNGKKVSGVFVEAVVLPRSPINGEPQYLAFKLQAIVSYDAFDQLVPVPTAPEILRPGNIRSRNTADPKYREALDEYYKQRYQWALLTSLEATPNLEWETINKADPKTWGNLEKELADSGISAVEFSLITRAFNSANGLDDAKMEAARKHFLELEREAANASSSPTAVA